MSFFWSMAGEGRSYYNAAVVNLLADDWKVNVVRAAMGVDETWGNDKGYLAGDNSGGVSNKQRVFDVVDAAIAKGIYVIIDWHSHNANNAEQAKTFFQEMANTYKDVPNVLYEIFNEPTNAPPANANTFWDNTVKPYAETVVSAIRAIDPDNVIIVGTPTWCADVDAATRNPVNSNNLVYTVHFYSAYTLHKQTLRDKVTKSLNEHNKAVFVSEFGVCMNTGATPLDTAEATTWLNFLDENKVSWVNWSICYKDEGASALKPTVRKFDGNWTLEDLSESGKYIRNKLIAASQREETEWSTSTLTTDLVIPNSQQTDKSAAISPVAAQSNNFSVGPTPASGGVKFFWQGKPVTGGTLFIYDALGNSVKSVGISDASSGNPSKRVIGSWDLTDAKGRRVAAGTYLVKGAVTQNGNAAAVSSIVVVGNR